MAVVLLLTSTPNLKCAQNIGNVLVQKKLAACVSILGPRVYSIYRWKKKIEKARECLMFIKSTDKKYRELERTIEKLHPYDVAELIQIPVKGMSKKYASWLEEALT